MRYHALHRQGSVQLPPHVPISKQRAGQELDGDSNHSTISTGQDRKPRRTNRLQEAESESVPNLLRSGATSTSRRSHLRKAKSVQFQCWENGEVKCQEHLLTKSLHCSLWWNDQELRDIRSSCAKIVDHARSSASNIVHSANGEVRGLEQFISCSRRSVVAEHRRLVLQAEDKVGIRQAHKVSRSAQYVAIQTAKLDTKEALKAVLSKWEASILTLLD